MFPPVTHKDLSGSQLSRIIECPASFKQHMRNKSSNENENESVYASEGTMLHAAIEKYLYNFVDDLDYLLNPKLPNTVKDEHGGAHTLTKDHKVAIEDCLEYLANVLKTCDGRYDFFIEMKTTMDKYDPLLALAGSGGTCDIVIADRKNSIVHVIDWKFGKGIVVYAADNDQLRSYALGAAMQFIDYLPIESYEYHTHVVQPRIDNYGSEKLSYNDLVNWADFRLMPAVKEAVSEKPKYNPGTSQCRWCAAKIVCEARKALAHEAAKNVFNAHEKKLSGNLKDDELAQVLDDAKFYESYIKDLRGYAYDKLANGQEVPGYKLVAGRSSRQWADKKAAEQWLIQNYVEKLGGDFEDIYVTSFVTPPQAEKLGKKVKNDDGFQELIKKIPGKPTMAPVGDKRPALDMTVKAKFKHALGANKNV